MEQGYKSLIVWQKGMELASAVHTLTNKLPHEEYALKDQMRRAAISIPSNIAEGSRRSTRKDYVQFLHIACGSTSEIETQIMLAKRWYPALDERSALALADEVGRMLSAMIWKLHTLVRPKT